MQGFFVFVYEILCDTVDTLTASPGATASVCVTLGGSVANWHFLMPYSRNFAFSKTFGFKNYLLFGNFSRKLHLLFGFKKILNSKYNLDFGIF